MATGIIQEGMGRPEGDDLSTKDVSENINVPPK